MLPCHHSLQQPSYAARLHCAGLKIDVLPKPQKMKTLSFLGLNKMKITTIPFLVILLLSNLATSFVFAPSWHPDPCFRASLAAQARLPNFKPSKLFLPVRKVLPDMRIPFLQRAKELMAPLVSLIFCWLKSLFMYLDLFQSPHYNDLRMHLCLKLHFSEMANFCAFSLKKASQGKAEIMEGQDSTHRRLECATTIARAKRPLQQLWKLIEIWRVSWKHTDQTKKIQTIYPLNQLVSIMIIRYEWDAKKSQRIGCQHSDGAKTPAIPEV